MPESARAHRATRAPRCRSGSRTSDAAYTVGHALLLGAALATRSADLFAAANVDRLHEPYRSLSAPLLDAVRADPPRGQRRRHAVRLGPDRDRLG